MFSVVALFTALAFVGAAVLELNVLLVVAPAEGKLSDPSSIVALLATRVAKRNVNVWPLRTVAVPLRMGKLSSLYDTWLTFLNEPSITLKVITEHGTKANI